MKKSLSSLILIVFLTLNGLKVQAQIERQQAMNWCWASCIQSVLGQSGRYLTQPQIAATLDGWPRDRPAQIMEVVRLLQYYGLRSWAVQRPAAPQELYQTLASGWKIIAFVRPSGGMVGHYIVLQGFTPQGGIIVSDPANGQTFVNSLQQLYYAWIWEQAIVVGR